MLDLDSLLRPRSIAVIGASTQPEKAGGVPIRLLKELGYAGRVYPVHPTATEIQGLPAYASIADINEPIDLAIVAVPAKVAVDVMEQLGQSGVRSAIYFTSGFAEVGGPAGAGASMQEQLADIARRYGVTLLGPNCLGVINLAERMYATFSPVPLSGVPRVGHIGLVSQSGAFGAYAFALARDAGLGLSYWLTTGNEAGLDVADAIEWLAADEQTHVILVYLEGCRDGQRLRKALGAARSARKPVVITKVGTTSAGARSAQSHTASLTGEDAVYQAVFDEYGVHRAHTLEEFFRLGYVLSVGRRPHRWQSPSGLIQDAVTPLAILTISGGVGILMADAAERLALPLPPMPSEAAEALRSKIPFASTANPIDVTGQSLAEPSVFLNALTSVACCAEYGSVAIFLAGGANTPRLWNELQTTVLALQATESAAPLFLSGIIDNDKRTWLEEHGCLVFREPAHVIEAVASLARAAAMEALPPFTGDAHMASELGGAIPHDYAPQFLAGTTAISEFEALRILADAGVPVAAHELAVNVEEAVCIAERLGYPVAVKLCSPHVLHKSDVGGVALNLSDEQSVRKAFNQIEQAAAKMHTVNGEPVAFEGAIVARMIHGWGELMAGVRRDPVFGLVALVGIGGTAVEIFRQTAFGLAPLSHERARAMLRLSRAAELCIGHRGNPAIDLDVVADVLVRLSKVAESLGERLETIEVNPFIISAEGVRAADAVITLR